MGRSKKIVLLVLILAILAGVAVSFADPSRPKNLDGGFAPAIPLPSQFLTIY